MFKIKIKTLRLADNLVKAAKRQDKRKKRSYRVIKYWDGKI